MPLQYSKTTYGKTFSTAYVELESMKIIPGTGNDSDMIATYNIWPSSTEKTETLSRRVERLAINSAYTSNTPEDTFYSFLRTRISEFQSSTLVS